MRELKFRAWVYYGEKLKKPHYSRDYESLSRFFEDHDENDIDQCIEQCTGLKDRDGKEIYEGDIIREKWFDEDARRGENRVGKCEYFTDGFVCWFVGGRFIPLGMFPVSHIEVIGNIHENPELIGKETE